MNVIVTPVANGVTIVDVLTRFDGRGRLSPWMATAVVSLVVGIVTVVAAHDVWFVYDDFVILGTRDARLDERGLAALFEPYNGHLMPATLTWVIGLAHTAGMASYAVWIVPVVLGNIVAVWIARRTMSVLGVGDWTASLAAPVLLVWGPIGWTLFWAPESVFLLGASLTVVFLLVAADDDRRVGRRDVWACAAAMGALLLHSAAVLCGLPAVALLLVRRQWDRAAVAAVPGLVYLVWLLTMGDIDTVRSVPQASSRSSIGFLIDMWSAPLRALFPGWSSAVVLVALVAVGVRAARRHSGRAGRIAVCLVAAAVLVSIAVTRSRVGVPTDLAQAGRYAAVLGMLLLPLVVTAAGAVASASAHRLRSVGVRWALGVTLTAIVVVPNLAMTVDALAAMERRGASNRQLVAAMVSDVCRRSDPAHPVVPLWQAANSAHVDRWHAEGFLGLVVAAATPLVAAECAPS